MRMAPQWLLQQHVVMRACDMLYGPVRSPVCSWKIDREAERAVQDVLVTLLNNLKVQERQNRVCTTVAIAIVAETCSPFTVLPALMNEYKVSF